MVAVRELFHFGFWLARTYGKDRKPADGLAFDPNAAAQDFARASADAGPASAACRQLAEKDARLTEMLTGKAALDAELERLRAEIAAIKQQNAGHPTPTTTTRHRPATSSLTCC